MLAATLGVAADEGRPPTVADAIAMVRIQLIGVTADHRLAAVSADGSRLAFVVWRGDLERNVNVYSLCVIDPDGSGRAEALPHSADAGRAESPPNNLQCPLTLDFEGDPDNQHASPIEQLAFVGNGDRVAFLGRLGRRPAQVYTIALASRRVSQLTEHPTDVRSFVVDGRGRLRVFSAVAIDEADVERVRLAEIDGAFLFDPRVFPERLRYSTAGVAGRPLQARQVRQYFWVPLEAGATPRLIFDSRQSHTPGRGDRIPGEWGPTVDSDRTHVNVSSLSIDPSGRYALFYPYARVDHDMQPRSFAVLRDANAYARALTQPYGLIDLTNGSIAPLLDMPHLPFAPGEGPPIWSPDGRSVLIHALSSAHRDQPARWAEVDLASRRPSPLNIPEEWRATSWTVNGVVAMRDNGVGRLRKTASGWSNLEEVGDVAGFAAWHPGYSVTATNGRRIVGVQQTTSTPPELAAYDLASKETHTLTDLNPTLKQRRHGRVEEIRWTYKHGGDSSGFLVKPIGFVEGRRYPLVVQLDDNMFGPKGQPYVLDGTVQLSGHPTQMLAAEGIAVLYLRQPEWLRHVVATAAEPEEMRRYVEAGIVNLDRLGVIDPDRVGVSGWSRAAYYVARIMTRSQFPFSAATMIDGGQSEYVEGLRPFWDGELARVRAPILLQAHGPRTLVAHAFLADRLDALGKSVELLYFATASHSTTTPRHRRRSLEAHVDWWRFWLQGRRDTDPRKRAQYERWEALSLHTPHLQSR